MPRIPLTPFGKEVKMRLVGMNESQEWLIKKVREDTGLFFDNGYLQKILTGKRTSPKLISSICSTLSMKEPCNDDLIPDCTLSQGL